MFWVVYSPPTPCRSPQRGVPPPTPRVIAYVTHHTHTPHIQQRGHTYTPHIHRGCIGRYVRVLFVLCAKGLGGACRSSGMPTYCCTADIHTCVCPEHKALASSWMLELERSKYAAGLISRETLRYRESVPYGRG